MDNLSQSKAETSSLMSNCKKMMLDGYFKIPLTFMCFVNNTHNHCCHHFIYIFMGCYHSEIICFLLCTFSDNSPLSWVRWRFQYSKIEIRIRRITKETILKSSGTENQKPIDIEGKKRKNNHKRKLLRKEGKIIIVMSFYQR